MFVTAFINASWLVGTFLGAWLLLSSWLCMCITPPKGFCVQCYFNKPRVVSHGWSCAAILSPFPSFMLLCQHVSTVTNLPSFLPSNYWLRPQPGEVRQHCVACQCNITECVRNALHKLFSARNMQTVLNHCAPALGSEKIARRDAWRSMHYDV